MKLSFAFVILLSAAAPVALAAEKPVPLKDAPGRQTVENNCGLCHSADYIVTNAPFPTRQVWTAEMTKMVSTYGAPVTPADQAVIIDYLVTNYGTGN